MNIHYDRDFEEIKSSIDKTKPPRLLLHICCAPCATACLLRLLDSFDVTLYYSNDNITDIAEWTKRLNEIHKLVRIVNDGEFEVQPLKPLKLIVCDQDVQRYYTQVQGLEQEKAGGARCTKCFELRLGDTKNYAEQQGFDYFGTTLTVSPYKNSRVLNQIGLSLQSENLHWLVSDFKKHGGYDESIRLCTKYDIYRQHYCGCGFSEM